MSAREVSLVFAQAADLSVHFEMASSSVVAARSDGIHNLCEGVRHSSSFLSRIKISAGPRGISAELLETLRNEGNLRVRRLATRKRLLIGYLATAVSLAQEHRRPGERRLALKADLMNERKWRPFYQHKSAILKACNFQKIIKRLSRQVDKNSRARTGAHVYTCTHTHRSAP